VGLLMAGTLIVLGLCVTLIKDTSVIGPDHVGAADPVSSPATSSAGARWCG